MDHRPAPLQPRAQPAECLHRVVPVQRLAVLVEDGLDAEALADLAGGDDALDLPDGRQVDEAAVAAAGAEARRGERADGAEALVAEGAERHVRLGRERLRPLQSHDLGLCAPAEGEDVGHVRVPRQDGDARVRLARGVGPHEVHHVVLQVQDGPLGLDGEGVGEVLGGGGDLVGGHEFVAGDAERAPPALRLHVRRQRADQGAGTLASRTVGVVDADDELLADHARLRLPALPPGGPTPPGSLPTAAARAMPHVKAADLSRSATRSRVRGGGRRRCRRSGRSRGPRCAALPRRVRRPGSGVRGGPGR